MGKARRDGAQPRSPLPRTPGGGVGGWRLAGVVVEKESTGHLECAGVASPPPPALKLNC